MSETNCPAVLKTVSEALQRHRQAVCKWLCAKSEAARPPIYASVDLRVADYKLAVVDTNLFPAGFNNVFERDLQVASTFVRNLLEKRHAGARRILILPEDHSRNRPYFANLSALKALFEHADCEVAFGSLNPELRKDEVTLELADGGTLRLQRAYREGDRLRVSDLDPDLLLVNNDFSQQPPATLRGLSQSMVPPIEAGWYSRRKSRHFEILHGLIDELAAMLDLDPWLLRAETEVVRDVSIQDDAGRERLAAAVEKNLATVSQRYKSHGITGEPYTFLKDNAGTYGFAVMNVKRPEEVRDLNSKGRKKMSAGKGKSSVEEFLIQEGVSTRLQVNGCAAEPVIYLIGGEVIGGFFRVHCSQDDMQSLNVQGSIFSLLAFSSPAETTILPGVERHDDLLTVGGLLAKVASIALGFEIQELEKAKS